MCSFHGAASRPLSATSRYCLMKRAGCRIFTGHDAIVSQVTTDRISDVRAAVAFPRLFAVAATGVISLIDVLIWMDLYCNGRRSVTYSHSMWRMARGCEHKYKCCQSMLRVALWNVGFIGTEAHFCVASSDATK